MIRQPDDDDPPREVWRTLLVPTSAPDKPQATRFYIERDTANFFLAHLSICGEYDPGECGCKSWRSTPLEAIVAAAHGADCILVDFAPPGGLLAEEREEQARADERARLAQTMRKAAAFALDVADKFTGPMTQDEFARKAAHLGQHFSLTAWAKSIEAGNWSDEPVAPRDPTAGFDDLLRHVEVTED